MFNAKSYTPSSRAFPHVRLRRNRQHPWLRRSVAETTLSVDDLIQPTFIRMPHAEREIPSMPGIYRHTVQEAVDYIGRIADHKIPMTHLFPYYDPEDRRENVLELLSPENTYCQAIREIKKSSPGIGIIVDVALDCYTQHGQDGLVRDGQILNDETLDVISDYAVTLAEAGADIIAPSEMMDGRVGVIRQALDAAGYQHVGIMSYAAKYSSALYGPFRDAVGSKKCLGLADKHTYQMDPRNSNEALREVEMDIQEGADSVMVKPGTFYLDVLYRVKETFGVPTYVYHISGEYSMLKTTSAAGYIDYEAAMMENLIAFKRAGADGILTYAAEDCAKILERGE
ncbi:MAG: porphobilinogen synthase [Alphaproteobacteria bacterium]